MTTKTQPLINIWTKEGKMNIIETIDDGITYCFQDLDGKITINGENNINSADIMNSFQWILTEAGYTSTLDN